MFNTIALNGIVFIFLKMKIVNNLTDSIVVLLINILTFVLTMLFAHISYTYFESYFLKLKENFRE